MAHEGDKIYALVSAAAYCPTPQGNIKGYNLIHNTDTIVVYKNANEIIYGFRGSWIPGDVLTNIVMGLWGVETTSRYIKDLKHVIEHLFSAERNTQVIKKGRKPVIIENTQNNRNFIITFTGHSLGGSIAIALYKEFYYISNYVCVVFDPYLPKKQKNFINYEIDQQNIKIYRIKGDMVSGYVDENSKDYIAKILDKMNSEEGVHSLHQFVDYDENKDVCEGKEYEEMVIRF